MKIHQKICNKEVICLSEDPRDKILYLKVKIVIKFLNQLFKNENACTFIHVYFTDLPKSYSDLWCNCMTTFHTIINHWFIV